MTKKRSFFITFLQAIYLNVFFYLRNNLTIYASACAFGFLFSFIPTAMMIFAFLIKFLHASPDIVLEIVEFGKNYSDLINLEHIISSVSKIQGSNIFSAIMLISIFFMSRRCFASIMDGMGKIFHRVSPRRPLITQGIILAGEIILVVFMAIFIVAILSAKTVFSFSVFEFVQTAFPTLFGEVSKQLVNNLPYILAVFFITIIYRFASGTKPKIFFCLISAISCSVTFWVTVKILNIFLNMSRYNFVYGVFSHLIIVLLEVFIFFIYFLFFAELVYVYEYFDLLLLGELYLLPEKHEAGFFGLLKRKLFISPSFLLRHKKDMLIQYKIGQTIFKENDEPSDIFYIATGRIQITRKGLISLRGQGEFLGETSCILNTRRSGCAVALSDCDLICIPLKVFRELIDQDSRITVKVLSRTSDYFDKVYGRNNTFLL